VPGFASALTDFKPTITWKPFVITRVAKILNHLKAVSTDFVVVVLLLVLKLTMTANNNSGKDVFWHSWVENEAFLSK